jgi:hypothetical protein
MTSILGQQVVTATAVMLLSLSHPTPLLASILDKVVYVFWQAGDAPKVVPRGQ